MVVLANRKGRMQSSESGPDLKIMQVGHGKGTDIVVSAITYREECRVHKEKQVKRIFR